MNTSESDEKKDRQFSQEQIGVTPSVAVPDDTNPSDATGCHSRNNYESVKELQYCYDDHSILTWLLSNSLIVSSSS